MELEAPAADQVELSVFGRGYGEAICLHVGNGDWVTVDSCMDPKTNMPVALSYLRTLGVSAHEAVRLVVVTHWDDDHIRGIGDIVEACTTARVACSAALGKPEVFSFVMSQENSDGELGSGLDELRAILRICAQRPGVLMWAKANLPLLPDPPLDRPTIVALSPSEDACQRSIEALIEGATGAEISVRRRYKAPEGPNGASIVLSVRSEALCLLLGGDLEVSRNPETGWEGVLKHARPAAKASVVKVPHHGSKGAHHPGVWTELAEDDPIAIVAPWARGSGFLPMPEDLDRLRSLPSRLFLTAMPSLTRAKKDPELAKMIRRVHNGDIKELRGWGHVRARRRPDEADWQIDLFGDAAPVPA